MSRRKNAIGTPEQLKSMARSHKLVRKLLTTPTAIGKIATGKA